MKTKFHTFLSSAILLGLPLFPQAQKKYLFQNANIIDGTGKAEYKSSILVEGNSITDIGTNISSKDATVIDMKGKTIIPSLISAHTHIGLLKGTKNSGSNFTRENILRQLIRYQDYGISNVLSMGTDRPSLQQSGLLDSINNNLLPVTNYFSAGIGFGVPNSAPPMEMGLDLVFRPSDPSQIAAEMDSLQQLHPFAVKMWVDDFGGKFKKMSPEIYHTILKEAHKRGLKVAAHVYYLSDLRKLVNEGLDIVAHSVRDSVIDDATIELMKAKKVVYIPTLSLDEFAYIYARRPEWINDPFFKASLEPGVYEMITDPTYQEKIKNSPTHQRDVKAFETALKNLKKLYDAGIFVVLGTDSGAIQIRAQGFSEHLELELLTQAGLTPIEAIKIGTLNAAEFLHISDKEGSIEKGKKANFIVLDADPKSNIKNTRKIESIWRNGVLVSHGPLQAK